MKEIQFNDVDEKKIKSYLENLIQVNSEIKGAAVISNNGMPIVSLFSKNIDEILIGAITAVIHRVSEHAVTELKRGDFKHVILETNEGLIVVSKAGENAILVIVATPKLDLDSLPSYE